MLGGALCVTMLRHLTVDLVQHEILWPDWISALRNLKFIGVPRIFLNRALSDLILAMDRPSAEGWSWDGISVLLIVSLMPEIGLLYY